MIKHFGKSSVRFEPESGKFFWIVCYRKPWMTGKRAEGPRGKGYLYIKADGRQHSASRLAWELSNGTPVPAGMEIDHINRVRDDNRPENLRVVDRRTNLENTIRKPGKTGYAGISLYNRPSGNGVLYRYRRRERTWYYSTLKEAIAGRDAIVRKEVGIRPRQLDDPGNRDRP